MLKENAIRSLKALLPKGQVFTDLASLISYEADGGLDKGMPEGVVFPHSTGDVVRIVQWAAERSVPLIARGAGTGLSGGAVADRGGIIVEFSRMNTILDIDEHGRTAMVEPAVINLVLDEQVKTKGLYFPPDPASQRASTIGGNVAENSGGPHCFKYGVTTNYVIGMDVVLADGRSVRVGGCALDYPAYDLCGLITGSEGMLALITSICVRLVRNPPAVKTMLAVFDSVEQAGIAVSAIIATGLVPATMEMMDQKIIRIVEEFAHAGLPTEAQAILIIEVDGYPASLDLQIEEVASILQMHGGHSLRVARSAEERNQIWFARKSAAGAVTRLTPSYYTVDITVPRSRLTETLLEVNAVCERYGLRVGYVFHAGDGNLHPLVLIPDAQDRHLMERVHNAGREMVELAVHKGGSLSGEHGVGIEKRQFMSLMYTDAELAAMWDIKQVFDPNNLLNPGKVFPLPASGNMTGEQITAVQDTHKGLPVHQTGSPYYGRGNAADTVPSFMVGEPHPGDDEGPLAGTLNGTLPPMPGNIFTPSTAEEAAEGILSAAKAGQNLYITGSTGVPAAHSGAKVLSTAGLQGIKTYAADDLYITVGAGTPLAEIQSFLAGERKQVPLATPWQEATIGGLVATNLNAPLRMRYGSLRDLVLCATVVLADGRVIRTGRPVIKNVAGYDLTKVFIGSHGTLGLISDITLKIAVTPRAQRTLLVPLDDLRHGLVWARKLLPLALIASAIVLCKGCNLPGMPQSSYALAYTAEGVPEDVQAELDQVRQALRTSGAPEPLEVERPSGTDMWSALLGNNRGKLQVRVGVAAKDVASYVNDQAGVLNRGSFLADMSSGLVYAMMPSDEMDEAKKWLEQLRQPALAIDGYAVVMDMPDAWQGVIEIWGYRPQAIDLMRGLKERWDPRGVLNPGVFIV